MLGRFFKMKITCSATGREFTTTPYVLCRIVSTLTDQDNEKQWRCYTMCGSKVYDTEYVTADNSIEAFRQYAGYPEWFSGKKDSAQGGVANKVYFVERV